MNILDETIEKLKIKACKEDITKNVVPLIKKQILMYLGLSDIKIDVDNRENYFNLIRENINRFSENDFKEKTKELKNAAKTKKEVKRILIEAYALAMLAILKKNDVLLYDEQILGAVLMYGYNLESNVFAEIKTGEGKTYTSLLVAYLNSLEGQVHIITSNDALATRDYENNSGIFKLLGITTGLIRKDDDINKKKYEYEKDIIYSPSDEIIFDYLRDCESLDVNDILQPKHDTIIIDEVDSILLDQAITPLIIAENIPLSEFDYEYKKVMIEVEMFVSSLDAQYIDLDEKPTLTEAGLKKFYNFINNVSYDSNLINDRILQNILSNVLFSNFKIIKGRNIRIVNDTDENLEFEIISETTGRDLKGQQFSDVGLTTAVQIHQKRLQLQNDNYDNIKTKLEKLKTHNYTFLKNETIYAAFLSLYKKVTGMSGTIIYSKKGFFDIYGVKVIDVPLHKESERADYPLEIYNTPYEKKARILEIIKEEKNNHPILIKVQSIEEAKMLYKMIKDNVYDDNVRISLLTADNINEENDIIDKAGELNQITIATDVAGRGTDIKISDKVDAGLCVINTSLSLKRVEQQFIGRSGRHGQKGVSYSLTDLKEEIYDPYIEYFRRFDKALEEGTLNKDGRVTNYTVKEGDTLSKVAKQYKISIALLKKVNNISELETIEKGKILKIPLEDDLIKIIEKIQEIEENKIIDSVKQFNNYFYIVFKRQNEYYGFRNQILQNKNSIYDFLLKKEIIIDNEMLRQYYAESKNVEILLKIFDKKWGIAFNAMLDLVNEPHYCSEEELIYRLEKECDLIFQQFIMEVKFNINFINEKNNNKDINDIIFLLNNISYDNIIKYIKINKDIYDVGDTKTEIKEMSLLSHYYTSNEDITKLDFKADDYVIAAFMEKIQKLLLIDFNSDRETFLKELVKIKKEVIKYCSKQLMKFFERPKDDFVNKIKYEGISVHNFREVFQYLNIDVLDEQLICLLDRHKTVIEHTILQWSVGQIDKKALTSFILTLLKINLKNTNKGVNLK